MATAAWVCGLTAGALAAEPQVTDPNRAVLMVRTAKPEQLPTRVEAVVAACRGRLRFALRDHPPLRAVAAARVQADPPPGARAVLDLYPCFTHQSFASVVDAGLKRPEVAAYAAEIGGRLAAPSLVEALVRELTARKEACAEPASAAEDEVCVWLAYASGPIGQAASPEARTPLQALVLPLLDSEIAKVREVSVESLHSWGDPKFVAPIRALVKKERSQGFDAPNESAVVDRFEQRARSLSKERR